MHGPRWLYLHGFASGRDSAKGVALSRHYQARGVTLERLDLRVPTLIVHGRDDTTVPIDGSRRWAAGKRHVRLVEVDDGHELTVSLPRIAAEADAHLATLLGPQ